MTVSTDRPHSGTNTPWHNSLVEFLTGLAGQKSEDGLLRRLAHDARSGVGADMVAIKLLVKDTDWLRVRIAEMGDGSWEGRLIPWDQSLSAPAMAVRRPMLIDDAAARSVRATGLGPTMVVPLGMGERTDGALLLSRYTGAATFTDGELASVVGLIDPAWVALCAVRQRVAVEREDWQGRNDRLANQLCDTVATDLFARDWSAPPPSDEPGTLDEVGYRILRAVIDNGTRTTDEDALVARVLHACDTVPPGLCRTDELRFRGCSLPHIPVPLLDEIEQWLTSALILAGTNSDGRAARISVDTCLAPQRSITISLTYQGIPPTEAPTTRSPLRPWYRIVTHVGAEPDDSSITLSWQASWAAPDAESIACDDRCVTGLR